MGGESNHLGNEMVVCIRGFRLGKGPTLILHLLSDTYLESLSQLLVALALCGSDN